MAAWHATLDRPAAALAERAAASASDTAFLGRTEDGWEVLARDGAVIYEAHGRDARRLCLEHARRIGVLRVRVRD